MTESSGARLLCALDPATERLAGYLTGRRWFASKTRALRRLSILDAIPLPGSGGALCLVRAELEAGERETYLLPLARAKVGEPGSTRARTVVAELPDGTLLFDPLEEQPFADALLGLIRGRRRVRGARGEILGWAAPATAIPAGLEARAVGVEQSNSSLVFGEALILKLCRKLVGGVSPELELGRFLAGRYPHTPALVGALEYRSGRGEPVTLAILQRFVPNRGDAWAFALSELRRFHARVRASRAPSPEVPRGGPFALVGSAAPPWVRQIVGGHGLDAARLLGRRTGELHLVLASPTADPAFAAAPLGATEQRELHGALAGLARATLGLLRRALPSLAGRERAIATRLLARRALLGRRLGRLLRARIDVLRIRTHGDLHLGQVLHTGQDFALIDFEGEPARPLAERRRKHPALRDVAGVLRSYHYAASTSLRELEDARRAPPSRRLARWTDAWRAWTSAAYLDGYLTATAGSRIVPADPRALSLLLDAFLLEKALYEIGYELNNRPAWVGLPLEGLAAILDGRGARPPC